MKSVVDFRGKTITYRCYHCKKNFDYNVLKVMFCPICDEGMIDIAPMTDMREYR